jgi:hypothetical protein
MKPGHKLGEIEPIFKRIDNEKIKEQVNKLNSR